MRVLFASTHGAGHFGPLVPFMDACLRKGHEVLVTGPPTLDPRGYPFRVGASPPADVLRAMWDAMPHQPPAQGEVITVGTIFAGLNVEAMLPPTEELIAEWKPDVVVREVNEYASAIAAERAGLPHVRVGISQAFAEEGGLAFAAPALEDVQPGIVEAIAASPYVTCFPESFDPAPFPVRRYRDPAADAEPKPLPDWWPGDERPLVYMTFGSVAAAFPAAVAAYRKALAALAELPVRVLLTVGRDLELGDDAARTSTWSSGCRRRTSSRTRPSSCATEARARRWAPSPPAGRSSSCRSSPTSLSTRRGRGSSAPAWSRRSRQWAARSSACSPTSHTPRRPGGSVTR